MVIRTTKVNKIMPTVKLTEHQKRAIDRIWKDHKDETPMNFLQVVKLYKSFVKMARKHDIDPGNFDFEADLVDWQRAGTAKETYEFNKGNIKDKFFEEAPPEEFSQIQELEEQREELEEQVDKLKGSGDKDLKKKVSSLEDKIDSISDKMEGAKKGGVSKDEFEWMVKSVGEAFQNISKKIDYLGGQGRNAIQQPGGMAVREGDGEKVEIPKTELLPEEKEYVDRVKKKMGVPLVNNLFGKNITYDLEEFLKVAKATFILPRINWARVVALAVYFRQKSKGKGIAYSTASKKTGVSSHTIGKIVRQIKDNMGKLRDQISGR